MKVMLVFVVNSFDRPPQLGAVGPGVYALNELSPLSSFVISSFIVDSRGDAGSCLHRSSHYSTMAKISAGNCCV